MSELLRNAVRILGQEPGLFYGAEWGGIQLSAPTNAVFGTGPLAQLGLALIIDDD